MADDTNTKITTSLQSVQIKRKKFSDFPQIKQTDDYTSIFLVGYETSTRGNHNVKVNLNSITEEISGTGEGLGGNVSDRGIVIETLSKVASIDINGYTFVNDTQGSICVFDIQKTGAYIQINSVPEECMTSATIDGETCLIFDICFANVKMGNSIRLYLPNFAGTTEYVVRLWRIDPKDENPRSVEGQSEVTVLRSKILPDQPANSYDWFSRFIVLGHVNDDGYIRCYSRTAEVINIFDELENDIIR